MGQDQDVGIDEYLQPITMYEATFGTYTYFHILPLCAMVIGLCIVHLQDKSREWDWLIIWGGITCAGSPWVSDAVKFFKADLKDNDVSQRSFWLVSISTFVGWVFAKSIYNASTLGGKYGIMGGLAYAAWYTAFVTVALSVYRMRQKGFKSLPEAINARYGSLACITYSLAILYRLEQEVWSNALVVAGFYGDQGSACLPTYFPSVVPLPSPPPHTYTHFLPIFLFFFAWPLILYTQILSFFYYN